MLTLFWGGEVRPGKALPFVPPPEAAKLRLTQASLSSKAPAGSKVTLSVRVGEDGPTLQLAVLREDRCENTNLDVLLDHYSEFVVEGDASVHIIGYLCPDSEEDPDGGPYSLDDIMEMQQMGMLPGVADDDNDDDDDDDDDDDEYGSDEDDDEDGDHPVGMYGDDDSSDYDSEEDDSDDSDEEENAQDHTIIEELPDEPKTPKNKLEAEQPAKNAVGKKQDAKKRAADAVPDLVPAKKAKGGNDKHAPTKKQDDKQAPTKKQDDKQAPTKKQDDKQVPTKKQNDKQAKKQNANGAAAKPVPSKKPKVRKFENGFMIEEVAMGQPDGKLAANGKKVAVQYTGRLASNNKVFDSSKGKPFRFTLGIGEVVKGFDRGVQGMRVGDKRRVTIPPSMGYGTAGADKVIPPNATLVFDLELVEVK